MNPQLFLIFSVVFVTLDLLWIQYFSTIIGPMIEKIQGSPIQMNMIGAILAYVTMLISYTYLAYDGDKPNYFKALILGFAIYGTYEFTNLALLKNWFIFTAIIDTTWGTILFALTTLIVYKIKKLLHF